MDKKRKVYAPFSQTSEAGVAQTPVEGYIDVNQTIYPTVRTGVVNENGTWVGIKSDDAEFRGLTKAVQLAGGGVALFPDTPNENHINMDGFRHLQIAIKSSGADTIGLIGRMGPDTNRFANLSPVSAGSEQFFIGQSRYIDNNFDEILKDTSQLTTANAWNVFTVFDRAAGQLNFVIELSNNAGGALDFEMAYRRLV